ncbi:MAG: hypothetical protein KA173_01260 [Rhodoferax sp.]|nr:hypothetical protein [Rhodoferax sp.]MBP7491181.1 hypothetical protein [Rhodoferax sp.]
MTLTTPHGTSWAWRRLALPALLCAAVFSVHLPAAAAPLGAGSTLPAFTLNDQHDKPIVIASDTRWVLFAKEKAVSDMATAVLSSEPAGVMGRTHLVYVVDISAMPALVTRLFALPKLRELPFSIALVREAAEVAQVADLPHQPGTATLLRLERGQIAQVAAVRSADELRRALELGVAPAKTAP